VVHDAQKVEAWLPNHRRVKVLGLVAKDEARDLAIIAVETLNLPQPVLSSEVPRVGLVTLPQMLSALVKAADEPAQGVKVVEVPEIKGD
jgi:hypothetical protein